VDEGAVGASRKLRKSAGVARRGGSFSGKIAIAHAKKVLREMRDRSVKVLSYFIEEEKFPDNKAKKIFKDMYGESASFVNVQNASEVLRTMNKLLIART
jgi:hypothetical protein